MQTLNKYELKQILVNEVKTIIFTKVNGEEREMECTLISSYLPEIKKEPELLLENKKENDNLIIVWSIKDNGWRSIKLDSIKEIK